MPIHQLSIKQAYDTLTDNEKSYAHHMAKAAWSGTRIILRQVSPEANPIFDFIIELHRSCHRSFQGRWEDYGKAYGVAFEEIQSFLEYAATFLSNVGNFYVSLHIEMLLLESIDEINRDRETRNSRQGRTQSL